MARFISKSDGEGVGQVQSRRLRGAQCGEEGAQPPRGPLCHRSRRPEAPPRLIRVQDYVPHNALLRDSRVLKPRREAQPTRMRIWLDVRQAHPSARYLGTVRAHGACQAKKVWGSMDKQRLTSLAYARSEAIGRKQQKWDVITCSLP